MTKHSNDTLTLTLSASDLEDVISALIIAGNVSLATQVDRERRHPKGHIRTDHRGQSLLNIHHALEMMNALDHSGDVSEAIVGIRWAAERLRNSVEGE